MTLTYAIADLHGRFDLLKAIYSELGKREPGLIMHLGDYVDRGPQSMHIVRHLMDDTTIPAGFTRKVLKGNHEDMMFVTLTEPMSPNWWIGNGGGQTLISYGHAKTGAYDPSVVPAEHVSWLDGLPKTHVTPHRIYVHAGVDPTRALDDQKDEVLLWWLYPDGADLGHGERHVVHGHHQFADGPKLLKNRTDLDTFAWYTGRIVIGVFDEEKAGGPIEIIEVVRKPHTAALASTEA